MGSRVRSTGWVFVLLVLIVISTHNSGRASGTPYQNQSGRRKLIRAQAGFISIDCGTAPSTNYTLDDTQITYVSDEGFVDSGVNYNVEDSYIGDQSFPPYYRNVRSFPEGDRNCYTLQPEQGKNHKYLIRAKFMYGNYDSKNQLPVFKLYLGVDEWKTINITDASLFFMTEIIHIPVTDHIDVCLVNIKKGTPFISSLELRQLSDSIYSSSGNGSLLLWGRWDFGSQQNDSIFHRYGDDVYDRMWIPQTLASWNSTHSSSVNSSFSPSDYNLPATVMATAATPADETRPWVFNLKTDDGLSQNLYVFMHFAELKDLQGQIREFSISLNDQSYGQRVVVTPRYFSPLTKFTKDPITAKELSISLTKTNRSALPPIINALEVYRLKELSQSSTQLNDVDAIKRIKSDYAVSKNWQGDPCIPMEYQWDGLTCSHDTSPVIISLNLTSSNLSGIILASFLSLKSLQNLNLSYNNLTGQVPEFLADFPSLTTLDLRGNNLTGSVPKAVMDKLKSGINLSENPNLCLSTSCQGEEEKGKKFLIPVLISIPSAVVILILITSLVIIWKLTKSRKTKAINLKTANERPKEGSLKTGSSEFSFSDVATITNDGSYPIGRGGFGNVYLGTLADGTQVAVKVHSQSSIQGPKALRAEAELLTRIHHKNLVHLIGYCNDGTNMALIYEYMSNGNLQEKLSARENADVLSWKQRLRIAVDAAYGLEYLHNGCMPPILHRDMKSSNILLNEKLQAKIADFGLSRDLPSESCAPISTVLAGTPGYLDPEYQATGNLNKKSDIYSFGILLLELITGQAAIKNPENIHIVAWIGPMIERGDTQSIIDPRLQGDFRTNSAWKAVEIALSCVASSGTQRPDMSHVLAGLKDCLEMEMEMEVEMNSRRSRSGIGSHKMTRSSDNLLEDGSLDVVGTESAPLSR